MKSLKAHFVISLSLQNKYLYTMPYFILLRMKRRKHEKIINNVVVNFLPSIFTCQIRFLIFSHGLNFTNDNVRDISHGLNFADGKFCDLLSGLFFAENVKIRET